MEYKVVENIEEAAGLISALNCDPKCHVGYCGLQKSEILHSLTHHFSDLSLEQSLIGVYQNSNLIGVLGLDIDKEEGVAEVWGPFIKSSGWDAVAQNLWSLLLEKLPFEMKVFHAYYHIQNQQCGDFLKSLGFHIKNKHMVLKANSYHHAIQLDENIREISESFYSSFINCHDQLFPATYYNGKEILNQLDENRKILISAFNGKLQGYIYYTAITDFQEGNIEFIGVHTNYRQKGIGRSLLKAALNELFTKYHLREITLSVSLNNQMAINLYKSAGFIEKEVLIYSKLQNHK